MNFFSVKPDLSDQIAVKNITPIQRARLHPKSLRLAVNAQCYDCIYDKSDAGTWRQQVEACPSINCPLYCQRPKATSQGETS
jgi:CMP-N-acetylneuraminic acid synthetase